MQNLVFEIWESVDQGSGHSFQKTKINCPYYSLKNILTEKKPQKHNKKPQTKTKKSEGAM